MQGTIYFAGAKNGAVKIGFTTHLDKRLRAIQTGSPEQIILHAQCAGDRRTEAYFHNLVAPHRLYGEWFSRSAAVADLIERVALGSVKIPPEFLPSPVDPAAVVRRSPERDMIESALQWIREIAEPVPFGERIEKTLRRVASTAGVSYRAVKGLWYGENTTTMKADVYIGLQEAFEQKMSRLLGDRR